MRKSIAAACAFLLLASFVPPAVAKAAPCTDRDLVLRPRWGAAAGSIGGTWRLRNTSGSACNLYRRVRVQLRAHGDVLAHDVNSSGRRRVRLEPGDRARAEVLWSNWCRRYDGPFRVRVVLPRDGGRLVTKAPGPPSCSGGGRKTNVSISNLRE